MYPITTEQAADLERRFTYHRPGGDQPERYTTLRSYAREMAFAICRMVPDSRERALAITKLEEAAFWANAGIARNEQFAEPEPPAELPAGVQSLAMRAEGEAAVADRLNELSGRSAVVSGPLSSPAELQDRSQIVKPIPGGTEAQQRFEQEHGMVAEPKPPAQHVQVMPAELSGSAGQNG